MRRLLLSHVLACYAMAVAVVAASAGAHLHDAGWPRNATQWVDLVEGRATLLVGAPLLAPVLLIWQTGNLLWEHSATQIAEVVGGWLAYFPLLAAFDWWLLRRARFASLRARGLPPP